MYSVACSVCYIHTCPYTYIYVYLHAGEYNTGMHVEGVLV